METTNSPFKQNYSKFIVVKEFIDVKIGDYALLGDSACKITKITKRKVGKFGVDRDALEGVDILTGKK